MPEWYAAEPDRGLTDEFYLSAFWDLCTCRGIGLSVGPIPWNHIKDYAEFAGLDRDNAFAFAVIIRKLDTVYLSHLGEVKQEPTTKPAAARGSSGRQVTTKGRPS